MILIKKHSKQQRGFIWSKQRLKDTISNWFEFINSEKSVFFFDKVIQIIKRDYERPINMDFFPASKLKSLLQLFETQKFCFIERFSKKVTLSFGEKYLLKGARVISVFYWSDYLTVYLWIYCYNLSTSTSNHKNSLQSLG